MQTTPLIALFNKKYAGILIPVKIDIYKLKININYAWFFLSLETQNEIEYIKFIFK